MTIAWNLFTPWAALAGGALIGLATALYLLGTGRVAGISGIVARPLAALWTRSRLGPEVPSLLFIAGLLAAPWAWQLVAPLPTTRGRPWWRWAAAVAARRCSWRPCWPAWCCTTRCTTLG